MMPLPERPSILQGALPSVSVVIPTYNRAALLKEALASVWAQEGGGAEFDMEVVVVDDASSDETPDVARADRGVRYVRLPRNQGHSGARNAGIRAATGMYVAFLDDDDLWLPHHLRRMTAALSTHPHAALAYGQVFVRTPDDEYVLPQRGDAPSGRVLGPLLMGNFLATMAVVVRRAALLEVGGFDEDLAGVEDYDLWIRLARQFAFVFVPEPVAVYRHGFQSKHLAEVTEGRFGALLLRVLDKAARTLPDHGPEAALRADTEACISLFRASTLIFAGQTEAARAPLEAALRRWPAMAHQRHARASFARFVGQQAVASAAAIDATHTLCRELDGFAGRLGTDLRLAIQDLEAEIWAEVAIQLGFGARARDREASQAASRAARRGLGILIRQKSLLWLLARGHAGRRLDPMFSTIRRWRRWQRYPQAR